MTAVVRYESRYKTHSTRIISLRLKQNRCPTFFLRNGFNNELIEKH